MRDSLTAGPSPQAQWTRVEARDSEGKVRTLLAAEDAANSERIAAGGQPLYHCVLAAPRLARNRGGSPIFSLTATLSRQPALDDTNIAPLVMSGTCGLELTVTPPDELLRSLTQSGRQYRTLFLQRSEFVLSATDRAEPLARQPLESSIARTALNVTLDRTLVSEFLRALGGEPCGVSISCAMTYRFQGKPVRCQGEADLAGVFDFLAGASGSQQFVFENELRLYLPAMIVQGIVSVTGDAAGGEDQARALFANFVRVARMILRSLPDKRSPELGECYALQSRPPNGTIMRFESSAAAQPELGRVEVKANLGEVLGEAFAGRDLDEFVHLVGPSANGGAAPIARRLPRFRSRGPATDGAPRMTATAEGAASLSLALRPSLRARPNLHAVLASDVATVPPNRLHTWKIDDLKIGRLNWHLPTHPEVRSLPIVEKPDDLVWTDRIKSDLRWYAAEFMPVQPLATATANDSPFLFNFSTIGHDQEGRPGLEATIRLTLEQAMPNTVRAELQRLGQSTARPVEPSGLAVALEIPFRDEHGALRRQTVPAIGVERKNDRVIATFRLADRWARICYGSLAYAGFQAEPARVVTSYSFEAYVPLQQIRLQALHGGKSLTTAVVNGSDGSPDAGNQPRIDPKTLSVRFPTGEFQFRREAPAEQRPLALHAVALSPAAHHATVAHHASVTHHATVANTAVIHPHLQTAVLPALVAQKRYGVQTFGRTFSQEVIFPCNAFGALYVQTDAEGRQMAIGCRDAYQLGQTEFKLYEEISDVLGISQPGFRLYRSLPTPGRFLVVPERYLITRFEPSEGEKAYRPAIYLYSTVDAENSANNHCVVLASLEPDLPAYRRRELLDALRERFHPSPIIEYPTELTCELSYDWSVADTGGTGAARLQVEVAKLWDSFQVSLTTDVAGVSQLQAMLTHGGIQGRAIFTLPDRSRLETALRLDLSDITGPSEAGPIEARSQGATAQLVNRIERPVQVSDLHAIDADGVRQVITVDRRLEPNEEWRGPIPAGTAALFPVAKPERIAATLPEIRSFVEDIRANVVFINQVNFANHGLRQLEIVARIKDVAGDGNASMTEADPVASLDFLLPLTAYLARPTLQYQAVLTSTTNQVARSAWKDWELSRLGNVIGLTWENVQ